MKTKIVALIVLTLINIGTTVAQNKTTDDYKFQLGESEHFIDGYSLNFQYQNGTALHMEFENGNAKYEWIVGPAKGNGNEGIPYRSQKIAENIYLINWHEIDRKDYVTIVFDFEKMVVHTSLIVGYENKPERVLRTVFLSGIIDHLKKVK